MEHLRYFALSAVILSSSINMSHALALRLESGSSVPIEDNQLLADFDPDLGEMMTFGMPAIGGFTVGTHAVATSDSLDLQATTIMYNGTGDKSLRLLLTDSYTSGAGASFTLGELGGFLPTGVTATFSLWLGTEAFKLDKQIGSAIALSTFGDSVQNFGFPLNAPTDHITLVADLEWNGATTGSANFNAYSKWSVPDGGSTAALLGLGFFIIGAVKKRLARP